MSSSNPEFFAVPKRLLKTRVFGRHDREDRNEKKLIEGADYFDEEIILNEAHMPKQTVIDNEPAQEPVLEKPSPDVLTIIGVLPHDLITIQRFFVKNGISCKFDRETVTGELGNWTVVQLSKNVNEIPEIDFHTQFGPNLIGSCYIGRFRYEQIEPANNNSSQQEPDIYRQQHNTRDRVLDNEGEKSIWDFWDLFKEFVLGKQDF